VKLSFIFSITLHIILGLAILCPAIYIASDTIKIGNIHNPKISIITTPYWFHASTTSSLKKTDLGHKMIKPHKSKIIQHQNINGKEKAIALFIHDKCQKKLLLLINNLPAWLEIKKNVTVSFVVNQHGKIIETTLLSRTHISAIDSKILQTISSLEIPKKLSPNRNEKFILPITLNKD